MFFVTAAFDLCFKVVKKISAFPHDNYSHILILVLFIFYCYAAMRIRGPIMCKQYFFNELLFYMYDKLNSMLEMSNKALEAQFR